MAPMPEKSCFSTFFNTFLTGFFWIFASASGGSRCSHSSRRWWGRVFGGAAMTRRRRLRLIMNLNCLINTLGSLLILLSINSYYFRLIHGLIASFLAFCSALGSWRSSRGQKERRARTPGRGPGRSFWPQGSSRPLSAMSHEPRRPRISR